MQCGAAVLRIARARAHGGRNRRNRTPRPHTNCAAGECTAAGAVVPSKSRTNRTRTLRYDCAASCPQVRARSQPKRAVFAGLGWMPAETPVGTVSSAVAMPDAPLVVAQYQGLVGYR